MAVLSEIADRELEAFRTTEGVGPHHILNLHDCVGRDRVYLDLVDWPTTFPKVFGILGWHIQLFHTQFIVSPPTHPAARPGAYGWHQDNNRMNRDFETDGPHPRVSVKVAYFLSDISGDVDSSPIFMTRLVADSGCSMKGGLAQVGRLGVTISSRSDTS